ncbi:Crossover junction endonuclease eme1-like protein [Cladobotryum mycophilum]|uniref:Crossover junction endonuclease eme1-like protein n=1 Tax=Cladobotryum mycophilum TaxID=491253 RepID=A0ABR0SJL3_9HYPO
MAPDVIDLISSSPSPPILQNPPPSHCPPAPSCGSTESKRGSESPENSHVNTTTSWPSDSFDFSDDFDDLPKLDTRGKKRPRISNSPVKQGPGVGVPQPVARPHQPPLRNAASERTRRPVIEPIELTSSFDPEAEAEAVENQQLAVSPLPIVDTRPARMSKTPIHLSLSSDPFASSPLPPRPVPPKPNKPVQKVIKDDFLNPFASSPPPPTCPSKVPEPKSRNQIFSDPFASSPEPAVAQLAKASTDRNSATSLNATHQRNRRSRKDWDPISSSAPEQTPHKSPPRASRPTVRITGPSVISIDSDSDPRGESDDEFPDIADFDVSKFKPRRRSPLRRSQSDTVATSRSRSTTAPKKSTEQRARERESNTAAKATEKERKRQEKEQAKEAKVREKERATALAEVNKIRTDKKVSTPEMIVAIPSSIDAGLKVQVETLLDGLGVEHTSWDSPAGNAFKWRRKITSRFDEEMGRWEPIPLQIKTENHALIIITADELVELALNNGLDSNVNQTKEHFPGHEMVYILEGMNVWMRKNRNIRNRQFASVVRQGADAAVSQSRRRNRANEEHISEDLVEDAMLRLQVEHDILIHHTVTPLETAQWIVNFTQHISTIPYKKQRDEATSAAGFCMESGQVRTGDDVQDTYMRMLQEIARVTAPIAYGIAADFGSVSKLVNGLEGGGPMRLEGVRKSANKDGALSDRTVGQAVSKRIYKVFTGRDESSTEV